MSTERVVQVRYDRAGVPRVGSGLRVGGRVVLTADHCADGTGHVVVAGGQQLPVTEIVRSGSHQADVAVLVVDSLPELDWLPFALVDTSTPAVVKGCRALGCPTWKRKGQAWLVAQVEGYVPTAEGFDPSAAPGQVGLLTLKITGPQIRDIPIRKGDLDQRGSQWAGMSGAVVITADWQVIGVICSHAPAEGVGSLTITPLAAIDKTLWLHLGVPDPGGLPRLPTDTATAGVGLVGDLPSPPPGFVARETVDRLAQALDRSAVAVVCALTGLRGVGKSQVAAAYARGRLAAGHCLVGWVNADTVDQTRVGLARIAERLGVADPDGDSAESAKRLREHLATWPGEAVIVFDNATDPDALRPFLPATGRARVVITSTDRAFTTFGSRVDVDEFTREESVAYLRERTGLDEDTGADAVAADLGDLPLALAAAAAVITTQRNPSYRRYLDRLHRYPVGKALPRPPGDEYRLSTEAALQLAIDSVEADDAGGVAGTLLGLFAVLSPDGIQTTLLHGLLERSDPPDIAAADRDDAVDEAIDRCVRGSLLSWSIEGDTLIMHRLVARALRERAHNAGVLAQLFADGLDLIEAHTFDEAHAWARRADGSHLAAHIEALWRAGVAELPVEEVSSRVLAARSWAVRQLRAAADLIRAIDLAARTLTDSERVLGPDHPNTLTARSNLAGAYQSAGRLDQATPLYEATLTEREVVLGPDHPDTLTSRNNLANAYQAAGRLDEAIALHEATLTDSERVLGPDHPKTLASRNNLAYTYQSAGRLDQAIPLFKATLTGSERVLGPDHPNTLTSRSNLANAYQSAGRLDEAIALHEATLTERERVLGPDHPKTLTSRNNLAYAYESAERLGEAIALFEATLTERERVLGPDHPDTLTSRSNLANAYQSAGRLDEAIALHETTLTERERILGPDHPDTLTSRNNLANAYQSAGRLAEGASD